MRSLRLPTSATRAPSLARAIQLAEKTGAALAFGWRSGLPLR